MCLETKDTQSATVGSHGEVSSLHKEQARESFLPQQFQGTHSNRRRARGVRASALHPKGSLQAGATVIRSLKPQVGPRTQRVQQPGARAQSSSEAERARVCPGTREGLGCCSGWISLRVNYNKITDVIS